MIKEIKITKAFKNYIEKYEKIYPAQLKTLVKWNLGYYSSTEQIMNYLTPLNYDFKTNNSKRFI